MMLDAGKMQGIPAHLATQTDLPWLNGLYVNTGHGSKGMVTPRPLCGEIIAAAINHEIMPVDYGLLRALDPNRFFATGAGFEKADRLTLQLKSPDENHPATTGTHPATTADPELHYDLGNLLLDAGQAKAAEASFAQALKHAPGHAQDTAATGQCLERTRPV